MDLAYASGAPLSATQTFAVEIRDSARVLLGTPFELVDGDPLTVASMTTYTVDLSEFAGKLIRVSFVMTAIDACFPINLDNVRFQ